MMSQKQTCIRFGHPCGIQTSSEWRQALLKLDLPWCSEVVVSQSSTALSITSRSAQVSAQMQESAVLLMRAVANIAGKMLDVEMFDVTPTVARTGYRWLYQIPKIVVARSGGEWGSWTEASLDAEHKEKIRERIESDLQKQLETWSIQGHKLGIELVSEGRPMVLKNAVSSGPKPVPAMARLDVIFSSDTRIEGSFWVGLLQPTGHGRIFRNGYEAQETQETQK